MNTDFSVGGTLIGLTGILRREAGRASPAGGGGTATPGDAWEQNDLVWPTRLGTPMSPRNLLRHLRRSCEKAGIPRVSFHALRHSAATIMLAQGVPERVIMDVLGHSTTAMMVRYQHVTDALRDDAPDAMDRAFRNLDEG